FVISTGGTASLCRPAAEKSLCEFRFSYFLFRVSSFHFQICVFQFPISTFAFRFIPAEALESSKDAYGISLPLRRHSNALRPLRRNSRHHSHRRPRRHSHQSTRCAQFQRRLERPRRRRL